MISKTLNKTLGGFLTLAVCATLVSCSSSKKEEVKEGMMKGSEAVGTVSDKSLTFNPDGSDSGAVAGLKTIRFDYDKASLSSVTRKVLSDNAAWLKEHTEANLQVEGHCDERGSIEYNLSLGERRANAVKDYLVSLGVDSSRLSVISYGKEKLLVNGDNDSDHAMNRRANFLPIPK